MWSSLEERAEASLGLLLSSSLLHSRLLTGLLSQPLVSFCSFPASFPASLSLSHLQSGDGLAHLGARALPVTEAQVIAK